MTGGTLAPDEPQHPDGLLKGFPAAGIVSADVSDVR